MRCLIIAIVLGTNLALTNMALSDVASDALLSKINSLFKPASILRPQWEAIDAAEMALTKITKPSIALSLDPAPVTSAAEREVLQALPQLSKIRIKFGRQVAEIDAKFDLMSDEGNIKVSGTVLGYMSVRPVPDAFVIGPVFKQVRLTKAEIRGVADLDAATSATNDLLDKFIDGLNRIIINGPELRIPVRMSLSETLNISDLAARTDPSTRLKTEGEISAYLHVHQLSLLIDSTKIEILVEARAGQGTYGPAFPSAAPADLSKSKLDDKFKAFRESFRSKSDILYKQRDSDGNTWIAVSKATISELVNYTFDDVRLCIGQQNFQQDVQIPSHDIEPFADQPVLDCSPTRTCGVASQCSRNEDTRNCSGCLARRFWDGGCIQEGNDPFCEAQKALQNTGYAVAYNTCLGKEAAAKFDCERLKVMEKAGCEANKEWLSRVQKIGAIGSVSGDMSVKGEYQLCLRNIKSSPALDRYSFSAEISADMTLLGNFQFVPKDLGHLLACVAQWTEGFNAHTKIPRQIINISGRVSYDNSNKGLISNITTDEFQVSADVDPPPFDAVFGQNPHLYVNCLPAAALKLVNVSARLFRQDDINQYFGKNIRQKIDSQAFSFGIATRSVVVGDKVYTGSARSYDGSLVYQLSMNSDVAKIPKTLIVAGYNGTTYVNGVFQKQPSGKWSEKNDQGSTEFIFNPVSESAGRILLRDESRKMLLDIDTVSKRMRWKTAETNDWVPLYNVVAAFR
ncbi:hypothetical protein [Methylobacterium sp. A54F]